MRFAKSIAPLTSLVPRAGRRSTRVPKARKAAALTNAVRFTLSLLLLLPGLVVAPATIASAKGAPVPPVQNGGAVMTPKQQPVMVFAPVNVSRAAKEEALAPQQATPNEIRAIHAPKGDPPRRKGTPINLGFDDKEATVSSEPADEIEAAPLPSSTGPSPGPSKTFKGEFLSSTSIPPDTMGAVGTNHVVTVSNDRMRIQNRNGVEISRVTLSSFWAGVALEGGAAVSAFDPKILFDRFNNRYIFVASANGQTLSSAMLFAVSQTSDPTGTWNRFAVDADPTATATGGLWIDYPSIGFNKNWITINENVFGYGTISGYQRADIYAIDKQAAYSNTLSSVSTFQGNFPTTCVNSATQETELGCGFTMAPAITEDNTTETEYLVEDWDSTAGQLRMSKLTGTPTAPILTVGTQFPQSTQSWRFDAPRIGTTGGYLPQKQQAAYLTSGTRIMANDSRIQNAVLRNGTLWTTHTVMLSALPQPAGSPVGGTSDAPNRDNHSGVQWWQIDPTQETGTSNPTSVLQRGRIEDPTADNCHNGAGGTSTNPTCNSTALQKGQFYAFPNISVNKDNDVLIGFTQFSALSYPNAAYAIRRAVDPANMTRDPVVYRPGQANYNIGSGNAGTTARQNRWGDYSAAMVDPTNDTDFWTIQEYAGTVRDFGIGLAGNWELWWANVKLNANTPATNGTLIINEFRLRGPQGILDEFVELFNPSNFPVIVNTTDNSDGWSLAYSSNGTTVTGVAVIPNGTVIPARGFFLVARNPDAANGPTLTYSLNAYPGKTNPSTLVRGADSDTGYSIDLADNGGLALFKTSNTANYSTTTRMDSVGFSTIATGLFKEGNGIPAMTTQPTTDFSFYRTRCPNNTPTAGSSLGCGIGTSGQPKDSQANENDFVFVDINGTSPTAGIQRLGAPGPENLDSPIENNVAMPAFFVDSTVSSANPPNRVRNFTPGSATTSTFGTLSLRRRVQNLTGAPVTRLRFRIVDITTFPAPSGFADLRPITSSDIVVSGISDTATCSAAGQSAPCSITVRGTTLEEPPTQPNGGGFNSTLSAGTITLSSPLAAGASVNVQFLLGVQQTGTFKFFINVETLP